MKDNRTTNCIEKKHVKRRIKIKYDTIIFLFFVIMSIKEIVNALEAKLKPIIISVRNPLKNI